MIPAVFQWFWALTSTTKQHTGEAQLDFGCCSKWPFKMRGSDTEGSLLLSVIMIYSNVSIIGYIRIFHYNII